MVRTPLLHYLTVVGYYVICVVVVCYNIIIELNASESIRFLNTD